MALQAVVNIMQIFSSHEASAYTALIRDDDCEIASLLDCLKDFTDVLQELELIPVANVTVFDPSIDDAIAIKEYCAPFRLSYLSHVRDC